ncbi:MAG: 2-succinyl-5-enolpyruvyl-6-hydroxy-3-cyclohexene-1-carboxylic-acid synthase [Solirubrobacteraceae bacterium]|nr:MAG: 2-succinyl-5-enolpyruvyl-6-hydroxy-3-cyclohexene-1-carboxylic-acid synthase [Solirubrobacterales bacterium]
MTPAPAHQLLAAFVDELARCGLQAACTSPGSRSTPLVLALAREPRLRCFSQLDERGAAFFALGLAKASGLPVALACTSGTAPAHYFPAVQEAHESGVPLLVLTADRPPELRDSGAGQTIDQLALYGRAAKWFFEVGALEQAGERRMQWMRSLACRAWWTATSGRAGVVHLNFPLREPLAPGHPVDRDAILASGRPGQQPWLTVTRAPRRLDAADATTLADGLGRRTRGVVVAGRAERSAGLAGAAARFAAAAGYALLADPLSGARRGPAAVAYYDALLRNEQFAAEHTPEIVVRIGDLPTSKPLRGWLAGLRDTPQLAFEPDGGWQDPDAVLSTLLSADPVPALAALAEELEPRNDHNGDRNWLQGWLDADAHAGEAIAKALSDELSEPATALAVGSLAPQDVIVWLASSMPVRDAESFWPRREAPPRALSNRGANGIDGTVSSALGAANAAAGTVLALLGDLALAHDVGGLLARTRLGTKLVLVVVNNNGGGIFHFLPVAGERDVFEEHVATPHALDIPGLAAIAGAAHYAPETPAELAAALSRSLAGEGSAVIEVCSDREANVAVHARAWAAVSAALR